MLIKKVWYEGCQTFSNLIFNKGIRTNRDDGGRDSHNGGDGRGSHDMDSLHKNRLGNAEFLRPIVLENLLRGNPYLGLVVVNRTYNHSPPCFIFFTIQYDFLKIWSLSQEELDKWPNDGRT